MATQNDADHYLTLAQSRNPEYTWTAELVDDAVVLTLGQGDQANAISLTKPFTIERGDAAVRHVVERLLFGAPLGDL